jgi:hypothetical protein
MNDAVAAGIVGAAAAGVPSTAWTLARGDADLLESTRAAGSVALGPRAPDLLLLATAVPVHLALSLGWAAALAAVVPRGHELTGCLAGALAIAALDLVAIGRRMPRIRALPQGRQWADHAAYGLSVGWMLSRERAAS